MFRLFWWKHLGKLGRNQPRRIVGFLFANAGSSFSKLSTASSNGNHGFVVVSCSILDIWLDGYVCCNLSDIADFLINC